MSTQLFWSPPERETLTSVEPHFVTLAAHERSIAAGPFSPPTLGLPEAAQSEESLVTIDAETDKGSARLPFPMRVTAIHAGRGPRYEIIGILYHLTLKFRLSEEARIDWHLDPGGHDATSRAAALDLLIAMSGSGSLVLWADEETALLRVELVGTHLEGAIADERRFLTEVLVVEAWSGQRLPIPEDPHEDSYVQLAQAFHWIRSRRMQVRFTSSITATSDRPMDEADELRLHEDFDYRLFGVWVHLGELEYRVPVEMVTSEREGDTWRSEFRPREEFLTATISPPRRGSVKAVREIENGRLLEARAVRETKSRIRAAEAADELLAEWEDEQGPVEDAVRDAVRRRWLL